MEAQEQSVVQEQQTTKKTAKIKKMTLDGFKSFGKYTELLFGDDFNVILGPNGSGKSNVLDALCFVLGKSSSKQLRAEKSSNLIYNGGKTKQPSKAAEVSIVFDNSNNTFTHPDKEIKVTRVVKQNGNSVYRINGKITTRQEFIELLNSARVDPDGYNIILQGDIIRLVEMSPIERRAIVEEIAGIGIYEEKKRQAILELEKVDEKLNEAEIILKERQGYLKDLKKDRDQALKYKGLNDKIKTNKASYLKKQLDKKNEGLTEIQQKGQTHKEKFEKLQQQIKQLRTEIEEKKKILNEINKEIEQQGEVEQVKIQKELEQLRVDIATNKTRITTIQTDINRINQRKQQLDQNNTELNDKKKETEQHKAQLDLQLETIGKTIKELTDRITTFKQKHNLADEAEIDKQFSTIDKQAEEKSKTIQELREKQQELIREKDKLEYQLTTIDERIAKIHELEKAHKDELQQLKNKKDQFKNTVLELNGLLNQDSQDAKTLAQHRTRLHELNEEEHKLSIKQSSVQESINANIAIKKVIENASKFGEVYGTISELGTSDSKYALALEVAAGNRINSLVVGDDKTASNAIKYLKEQKLGVATFLPLNKTKPVPIDDGIKALLKKEGVQGLAIDLLEYDPRFKHAFSHVFGNTIVVNSIETARKIGIGTARMVSVDGDLCETSGAMIGGYRQKKAGTFRAKDLDDKLKNIRNDIADIENDISKLTTRRQENEDKITRYRELKATLEGEIIKQEKSLHLNTGDFEANKKYKEELLEQITKVEQTLKKAEDTVVISTKDLTDLKIKRQQLRDKIQQLRNPAVLAELNAFEEKKKQLEQEHVRLDEQKKSTEAKLKDVIDRDINNTHKLHKDLDKEKTAFQTELKHLESTVDVKEKDLTKKQKDQEQFFSQYKGLFDKRNKTNDEVKAREDKILGHEEHSRKEELTLNTHSIEEARIKAEIAGITAEYEQYNGVELDTTKTEEELKKEINQFERMMADIGNVNMRALEIYEDVNKEYEGLTKKKETLMGEKDDVNNLMQEIEGKKTELFTTTLSIVNENFQRIFKTLNHKGEAELILENKEKPFEGGLRINVKITGTKFLDIRSLSGGEKTMTALSFLFAIQEHQPATFYILDEVDAALDKHNSEKLAKLIRQYCGKAQYIVISHNDAIISEGDILYGVSMQQDSGLSKVVSLRV